jgi:V/A-type H+-transporting ATPase subunit A
VAEDMIDLRAKMLKILFEENKLLEIVKLVGEDVLPDDQRLILEISRLLKVGFLQQNAFHKEDTFVPINKQYLMLKVIDMLYERGSTAIKMGVPISVAADSRLYDEVIKMKYNIPNDRLDMFREIMGKIKIFYDKLQSQYA